VNKRNERQLETNNTFGVHPREYIHSIKEIDQKMQSPTLE